MTNRFSIYELFLMGIAFETDAEANGFVDALNKELNDRMEKLIEKNMKIDCIFEYGRELSESERAKWLERHSEDIADWTLTQKHKLKNQVSKWRESIPGIVQNKMLDELATYVDDAVYPIAYRLERAGLVTIGELEAADLSKIDGFTAEKIDEIQNHLLWWKERRFRDEYPNYYEQRKAELLAEQNPVKNQEIEPWSVDEEIENLDLSVRAYNRLKRAGINTLADLKKMTLQDLRNIKNIGKKDIQEICEKAKKLGFVFVMGEDV